MLSELLKKKIEAETAKRASLGQTASNPIATKILKSVIFSARVAEKGIKDEAKG